MKLDKDILKGFVGSVLAKNFDQAVKIPSFHEEWWELCTSDNKFVAIAAPRGHAKSTAITHAYALAAVLFRERSFVIIVSDTESQAILFLNDIKRELLENEDLVTLFGFNRLVKDSESDIIGQMKDGHKFRIVAKGSEQKVRGLKWNSKRPDLILGDDLENDEIVLNQDRREKFRRWFYGALLPALSDNGVIRIVGTILHLDSCLERLMPPEWSKYTTKEDLRSYSTNPRQMWKSVRYRAHNLDYSRILWKEKFTEKRLKEIREEYVNQGMPDVYSQEYLNNPIDESRAYFRRGDFPAIPEKIHDEIDKGFRELHYYVGVDLAISERERADYTTFVVGGLDSDNNLYIMDVVHGRMDSIEIIEAVFAIQNLYKPEFFMFEKGQITKAIGPFLREEAFKRSVFPIIEDIQPSVDKQQRARSIQGRMRVNSVYFDKKNEWYAPFEQELLQFPKAKHDDQVDAFAYLGLALDKFSVARTSQEIAEEEYEEMLNEHGQKDQGRSMVTGY